MKFQLKVYHEPRSGLPATERERRRERVGESTKGWRVCRVRRGDGSMHNFACGLPQTILWLFLLSDRKTWIMHLWPPATTHRSTPMLLAAAVLPVAYAASVPPFLRRPRRRGPRKGCGLIRDHQKRSWLAHLICSAGRKLSLRRVVCASTR